MDKISNTIILIDYDNVFVTLKNNYRDFSNPNIMYDVITEIRNSYSDDNILCIKLFADFQKAQISDEGYDILKRNHVEIEHVFNGKNASDVILMINCIKYLMQYPHIDKIVLVSSDSDLVPIFREVQLLGKQLEVLYFEVNTAQDHIDHIREIGIKSTTIEQLMGKEKYTECGSLEEFYSYKTKDRTYFESLLQCVNNAILENYNKFLKIDENNKIKNVGAVSIKSIREYFIDNGICPMKELHKNPANGSTYCNLIDMLLDKKIIEEYKYTTDKGNFSTFLLNEEYLISNSYSINNLITKENYKIEEA